MSGTDYYGNKKISYSTQIRPKSKVKKIKGRLDLFIKNGRCQKCQRLNSGKDQCQFCNSSDNQEIDKLIQSWQLKANNLKETLEWIPYQQFENVEYLAEGGFGKVYKTKWNKKIVILKSLNDSQDIKADFLREIANHKLFNKSSRVVNCYGISQDPETKNYLMVMEYIKGGDLRKFLKNNQLNFKEKLDQLWRIACGLKDIHDKGLIHQDFHSGNILNRLDKHKDGNDIYCLVTDLGLCRPANEESGEKIYGVLPYIAPEVLNKKSYTQASDIYAFGMVAYEVLSGLPPYYDKAHDENLAISICCGLRPNLDNVQAPKLLKDLIEKCLDAKPAKRPKTDILKEKLGCWRKEINNKEKGSSEFKKQYQEVETAEKEALCQKTSRLWQQYKLQTKKIKFEEIERIQKELFNEFYKHYKFKKKQSRKKRDREVKEAFDKLLNDNLSCQIHPQAVYTSRCLSEFTDNLPKLRILEQLTVNINASAELSQSMQFDILQSNTKQQLLPVFPTITNQREIKRQKTLEEPLYQTEQNQQQFQAQIQIPPKNN